MIQILRLFGALTGRSSRWFLMLLPVVHGATSLSVQAQTNPPQPTPSSAEDFEQQAVRAIRRIGILKEKSLTESSGLARSSHQEHYWTINDSGNPPIAFLFRSDGKQLTRVQIKNSKNRDWEASASYQNQNQRWIMVADVGDNLRRRQGYQLYFFADPTRGKQPPEFEKIQSVVARSIEFTYADPRVGRAGVLASKNCEAVAIDPATGDIWFIEKVYLNRDRSVTPGVYVLPAPAFFKQTEPTDADQGDRGKVAKRIGSFPIRNVTGMSFSPDGRKLIIRNYLSAHLYVRSEGTNWVDTINTGKPQLVALPLQGQGEAVCFSRDSKTILLTSEGRRQPVWEIDLSVYIEKTVKVQIN